MRISQLLLVLSIFLLTLNCVPRMDERGPRYNPTQCPFCVGNQGVCRYCEGNKKCPFCRGLGERKTVVVNIYDEDIKGGKSYHEKCPFCKGNKICHYCNGNGICYGCDGSGNIKDWDYFTDKSKKLLELQNADTLGNSTPQARAKNK